MISIFSINLLNYFPSKVWLFIWTNLNSLYLGILCAKFRWNLLLVLRKEIFLMHFQYFHNSRLSPFRRVCVNTFSWPRMFYIYAKFGWNWSFSFWEEGDYVKSYCWWWGEILIKKAHLCLWFRWAKKVPWHRTHVSIAENWLISHSMASIIGNTLCMSD